jgi:hypothetical protein
MPMTPEGSVYAPYWACRHCNVIPFPTDYEGAP